MSLTVLKTRSKTVFTMSGPFIAHETVKKCPTCFRVFYSDALLRMVPHRCNVAYDVLIFVGQALFQRHRTTLEVRAELAARNIRLCLSEIDYLGRKFVLYLALGHQRAKPRIRQAMNLAGGYVLHLDATHEGNAPALMTGMDSLSKVVLANVKVPSEHADYIAPFLRRLLADYGAPRACVHDMGTGILKAVTEVFPGIPDFICHFHFLRDIGKDFLEPAYSLLRKRLRIHAASSRLHALVRKTRQRLIEQNADPLRLVNAIKAAHALEDVNLLPMASTYSLALWCLHGKNSGDGYGFPFDRPHLMFAERLLELNHHLPKLLNAKLNISRRTQRSLFKLAREVSKPAKDIEIHNALNELRWRCLVFDRLRKAMRIAQIGGGNALNDDGATKAISSIRQSVEKFRRELENDPKLVADPLARKMAEQIDKYGDKLFAEPIEVKTPKGGATIYPQRTNNMLEQFFRGLRRGHRRKTGNDSMRRVLQTMLADTPLIKNLDNPKYMDIILNGKKDLEELFAELGAIPSGNVAIAQSDTGRILPGFRSLIKLPTLPDQVARLFTDPAKLVKSN